MALISITVAITTPVLWLHVALSISNDFVDSSWVRIYFKTIQRLNQWIKYMCVEISLRRAHISSRHKKKAMRNTMFRLLLLVPNIFAFPTIPHFLFCVILMLAIIFFLLLIF